MLAISNINPTCDHFLFLCDMSCANRCVSKRLKRAAKYEPRFCISYQSQTAHHVSFHHRSIVLAITSVIYTMRRQEVGSVCFCLPAEILCDLGLIWRRWEEESARIPPRPPRIWSPFLSYHVLFKFISERLPFMCDHSTPVIADDLKSPPAPAFCRHIKR